MDFSEADPLARAASAGAREGSSTGETIARADGARLGALHGATLGAELGFAEGFGLAAAALFPQSARGGGGGGGGGEDAGSRSERAATALVGLVRALELSRGAPIGADVDIVATVLRARSLEKQLASSLGLPPPFLDAAALGHGPTSGARRVGGAADLDF
jgi:hypothetical protein